MGGPLDKGNEHSVPAAESPLSGLPIYDGIDCDGEGFRTPAIAGRASGLGPAYVNLHHHGHRLHDRRCLKAVVHPGDLNREQIVNSELEDEPATDRAEMMRRAADRLGDQLRMLEAGLAAALLTERNSLPFRPPEFSPA